MTTYYKCMYGHIFSVRSIVRKNADQIYCPFCGTTANHRIKRKEYEEARK